MSGVVRNLMLMLADALCIGGCWTVSVLVYHACGGNYEPTLYLQMWPVVPVWLAINVIFRLYHGRFFYPAAHFSPVEEMRRLVGSAILVHIGVAAVLALARQTTEGYSRFVIVISGVMTAALAQMMRDAVRRIMKHLRIGQIPVALFGDAIDLAQLTKVLEGSAYLGFSVIKSFSAQENAKSIISVSRTLGVRILFVCEDVRLFGCQLRELSEWFSHIEYFPRKVTFPVSGSRIVTFDGVGGIEFVNQWRMSVLRLEKLLVDKILATVVFVIVSPALIILALLVKLSSPGAIIFKHERLGMHGKSIRIWKFRTMYVDAETRLQKILENDKEAAAEWERSYKLKNDPRVTPLGRILRKISLDELPQIFNVLGGTMALVGPRPIVEAEKKYYGASYDIFSSVKPGMTGLWQVSGRSDCNYEERVALDVHYILNWSPWLDFWIVYRTIAAVLKMRGSY